MGDHRLKSDEQIIIWIAEKAEERLDAILQPLRNNLVARHVEVPNLCYDLLQDYAELRKMCNKYQLMHFLRGKELADLKKTKEATESDKKQLKKRLDEAQEQLKKEQD